MSSDDEYEACSDWDKEQLYTRVRELLDEQKVLFKEAADGWAAALAAAQQLQESFEQKTQLLKERNNIMQRCLNLMKQLQDLKK